MNKIGNLADTGSGSLPLLTKRMNSVHIHKRKNSWNGVNQKPELEFAIAVAVNGMKNTVVGYSHLSLNNRQTTA